MPSYFPENNTPLALDTETKSLQKINDLLSGGITVSVGEVEVKNDAGNPVPVLGNVATQQIVNTGSIFSYSTAGTYGTFDCGADADFVILSVSGGGGGFTHNIEIGTTTAFTTAQSTSSGILVFNEKYPSAALDTVSYRYTNSSLQTGSSGVYVLSLRTATAKYRYARLVVSGGGGGGWQSQFISIKSPFGPGVTTYAGHRIPVHGVVDINSATTAIPVTGSVTVTDRGGTGETTVSTFTSTSSATLKPANGNRKLLTVFNEGAGNLHILYGSGTASTTNYSVRLSTGEYLEIDKYVGQVNAIFASAGTARVTEIT